MGVLFTRNFTTCESYGYLYPFPPWIVELEYCVHAPYLDKASFI